MRNFSHKQAKNKPIRRKKIKLLTIIEYFQAIKRKYCINMGLFPIIQDV